MTSRRTTSRRTTTYRKGQLRCAGFSFSFQDWKICRDVVLEVEKHVAEWFCDFALKIFDSRVDVLAEFLKSFVHRECVSLKRIHLRMVMMA